MNYIDEYLTRIRAGSVVVGKWVRLLYEYIAKGLDEGLFFYDAEKAEFAVDWIEQHCFHTEGPKAPKNLVLELWQRAFVSLVFGIVDADGKRQFREVIFIVSRKNGKSLLAAAIAKYVWYNGGFGARIYTLAPKLDQADIIYNDIWQMTQLDPEFVQLKEEIDGSKAGAHQKREKDDGMLARHRMSDLCIPATNSTVKKIAFSAKKSDGFNPSLTICDEIASWEGDAGLKQYEVMKSATGARDIGDDPSILLSCSTSGYINDSIYDELIKRATRFLLGESKETKLLPLLYMIDDVEKWNDLDELRKSNPNLGVSVGESFLREEIAVAEGSLSKKAEFIVKYCNIKQNSSLAWLSNQDIQRNFSDRTLLLEDFSRHYCVCGIDLSRTTDLTAAVCLIEKNDKIFGFAHFWLPNERIDEASIRDGLPYRAFIERGFLSGSGENFIDYHDCEKWITELVSKYKLYPLQTGYDRYSAQYLVDDLKSNGFQVDDVFQGENLTPVINETEGLIRDGAFDFGDNDLMKIHLLNSAIKVNADSGRKKLVKINSRDHIDGCAALLDAMCVRQKWSAQIGQQLKNTKR